VLGLVQVGLQGHADRFTYLPHIGLYLLITWGIADLTARWRYRPQVLGISAAVVIAALTWRARTQTQFWRDTETLWRHALAVTTNNDVAHADLADILLSRNQVEEAIAHFESALAIRPVNPVVHNKIGYAFLRIGNVNAAIAHWKAALESDPHDLNAESNLAWVFATSPEPLMRDGVRAVEMIQDVIKRSGARNAIILRTLAAAYAESGRYSEAINTGQEALELAREQGNSALASDLQRNIEIYKTNTPLRDPSLAHEQSSQ
jgi:tetratricopeptide (TPR) repeat protein